jgi:hypothetical protein
VLGWRFGYPQANWRHPFTETDLKAVHSRYPRSAHLLILAETYLMPRDRRPAAVLVVAILNMFFGGMNLLGLLCALPSMALLVAIMPPVPGSDKNLFRDMYDAVNERFPFLYFLIGSTILTLLLNTGVLTSGIGLWKMRIWARRMAIVCALAQIALVLITPIFQILWINPAMADWQEHFHKTMAGPNAPPPPTIFDSGMYNVISIFAALFGSIYPLIVLIILFLPHVRAAFAGAAPAEPKSIDDLPEALDADDTAIQAREVD